MKIFFDTNIIMDYLLGRECYQEVDTIVKGVKDNNWYCYISSASLYTLAYTIEKYLKVEDRSSLNPRTKTQRISLLRHMLSSIVDMFNVVGLNEIEAKQAIENISFDDIEDSMQYESAVMARCDVLLTINIDDFENADKSMIDIVSPGAFIRKYI